MTEVGNRGGGSGNTAIVAIVVLILIAVIAFFVLYRPSDGNNADRPDVNIEVDPSSGGN
ncbi:MAG TPA: hypothetical protein VFG50_07080 [Rhodothermales bacterium]|nr:hypothetical protein [Rhodothermales bacterium]